jgi:hypothetical protein
MRMRFRPALLWALLLMEACSPSLIPGTQIQDRPENRAALQVLSDYKRAAEALDAEAVLELAAPDYFDSGASSRSKRSVNYATLQEQIPAEFRKLKALRMDITVKDARVEGDKAQIDYFIVLHYSIALPSGDKWMSESDDARLSLAREDGKWKVIAGL